MSDYSKNPYQYDLPTNVPPLLDRSGQSENRTPLPVAFGVFIGVGLLATVCVLLGISLFENIRHPAPVTPPSMTIPVPPQAQQINTANQVTTNKIPSWFSTRKETRFIINESPDAVITYYKGELAKSSWRLKSESLAGQTHLLQFDWLPGCTEWALFLFAVETAPSQTAVQLNIAVSGCE